MYDQYLSTTFDQDLSKKARITACIDNGQICDSEYNCYFVKGTDEPLSQQSAVSKLLFSEDISMTEAQLAKTLLSAILTTTYLDMHGVIGFNNPLFCQSDKCFSRTKWIEQIRTAFEVSLAALQIHPVDIARGNNKPRPGGYSVNIPPNYRGICRLVKFRTVGWRNISAWGLIGLLALPLAITLASMRTEEDEFWIAIFARKVKHGGLWLVVLARLIPWTRLRADVRTSIEHIITSSRDWRSRTRAQIMRARC